VPVVDYTAGDLGTICDIALDAADNAYVVFRDDLHSQLVYGTDASGSWVFEVADGPGFDTGGSVEANMAIAVTPAGVPHVAYGYSNNEQVRWATRAANGTWTREQANPSWGDNTGYAFDIALDPSASYRPTIVYSYDLGTPEEVRLTYRTGAGAWTNVAYATGGDYDYALGGIAFTSSGTAWIPYDIYTTQAVTWTAAGGFTGAVTLDASSGTTRGKVVVDTLGQPIVATGYGTYHRVGTSWIESAYESFVATGFDPAINAAGDFGLGVIHAGGLELLYPDPYYSYEYQGPADGTAMAAAMDSTGRLRACFFRNDQLLVY
jgi:hypothetical protein